MAAESGFLPPVGDENKGLLGRLWANVWQWFAPGWKDEKADIIVRAAGANDPVWTQIGATDFWAYLMPGNNGGAQTWFWTFIHINHDYRIGSPVYVHVHWLPGDTNSGNVQFNLSIAAAKGHNQQAFNFASPSTFTLTQAAPGVQYQHMIAEMTDADAATLLATQRIEPDSVLCVRVARNPGAAGDTYGAAGLTTGQVFVNFCDAHYQVSRFATKNRTPRDSAGNLVGFYR
jgi:hypothetical protein